MGVQRIILLLAIFLFGASIASAQPWQITTPRQVLPVPGDGSIVNFPNVNLIAGMKYRVHASQRVSVSSGSDIADACYYVNIIPLDPNIVNVSLKTRTSATTEDWFHNFWISSGFQNNYQSSHNYDASITSAGVPLIFRFQDTQYGDNIGNILVDVARETPGVVVQKDTLDFGIIPVSSTKVLLDSIESYGINGYNVSNVSLTGPAALKFTVRSERTVPFSLVEATNEFQFTYAPTANGRDSAQFHIFSSNGFGADTEKIIYLFGGGSSTSLKFIPDTLDFGTINNGTTKTLTETISNSGLAPVQIMSFAPKTAGSAFSLSGALQIVPAGGNGFINVTFAPLTAGPYLEEFIGQTDDGTVVHFFAKGISKQPKLIFSPDTLDFGAIKKGTSKMLPELITNPSGITVKVTSIVPETPGSPYSVAGAPVSIAAGGQAPVNVTFAPTVTGTFFEIFDVAADDGSTYHFYAKGISGVPKVNLEKDVLDFGQVILKQSRTLQDQFGNIGSATLNVVSTTNTNPLEYSIVGNQGSASYEPGHSIIYSVTFSPQVHIPFCQNHDGKFIINYDDGTSSTITFLGCDHQPLDVKLTIDTFYFVRASQDVDVPQRLVNSSEPLDSTLNPVVSLKERISYDPNLVSLTSVSKGSLISAAGWNLGTTKGTGTVDIDINSSTEHFGPDGILLVLHFHALDNVVTGQFTSLIQSNINFNDPLEPFATTDPGKITISDICFPVNLKSGNQATSVEQNSPNPFNPSTHIQYAVGNNFDGSATNIRITLYDQLGRFVAELVNMPCAPGIYDYKFDGSSYPSGAYSYVFQAGDHVETKTMVLVR